MTGVQTCALPIFGLVFLYLVFLIAVAAIWPKTSPAIPPSPDAPRGGALARRLAEAMIAPLLLILAVIGSILAGVATPSESASIGAVGAILLALWRGEKKASWMARVMMPVVQRTAQIVSMIFLILIGATLFSLVFRGFGGDDLVSQIGRAHV